MNTNRWTQVVGVVVAVFVVAAAALATPLKSPKRVVNSRTVDLTPLFQWWTNHTDTRPLQAWVHVTGTVVSTNAMGWVVDARVESSERAGQKEASATAQVAGSKRILLRHPPVQDRATFEQLAGQLRFFNAQRTQAANTEQQAHEWLYPTTNSVRAIEYKGQAWDHSKVRLTELNAAAEKKRLDGLIQETRAKLAAWPSPENYTLDCFALQTGTEQNRMPVYEHGASF